MTVKLLKDDGLAALAADANVAQFVSFGPGSPPTPRHSRVRDHPADAPFADVEAAIAAVLERSWSGTVNVRTFRPDQPKSRHFSYGLRTAAEAAGEVRGQAAAGSYCIVNETIDVEDGGVSGVLLGGVAEFAPGDTPRCVEKPGTAAIPRHWVAPLFSTVYGFTPDLDFDPGDRIEFSLHPHRVGVRRSHTVIWEIERVEPTEAVPSVDWPNRFSRHLGDKAYGLLVAHLLGLPVPRTTVVARRVAPFTFGSPTGSAEIWTRTCPVEQVAGKYTTVRGWLDPYRLMAAEDPGGDRIASVLAQQQVDAAFSGATLPREGGTLVEGRRGFGDDFMLGDAPPETLPDAVVGDVQALADDAGRQLGGDVRLEWAHDGERAWVVQLHRVHHAGGEGAVIYPGQPTGWTVFVPQPGAAGLDALRRLIARVGDTGEGILVAGDIGVTSHVGDVLRKARVPSRLGPPGAHS